MKYIDTEKLEDKLIEIEERHPAFGERLYDNAYSNCLSEVRLIISSLLKEQEQPEVDLEKEIEDYWEKICDDEFGELIPRVRETAWFDDIARHFYELGLNTRKEAL